MAKTSFDDDLKSLKFLRGYIDACDVILKAGGPLPLSKDPNWRAYDQALEKAPPHTRQKVLERIDREIERKQTRIEEGH